MKLQEHVIRRPQIMQNPAEWLVLSGLRKANVFGCFIISHAHREISTEDLPYSGHV